ncbi:MAG: DUF4340 domain-containing protein [Deltaproteobacteria bacterium]|nr:DUF4340 domain-containing protein [Deltaproteobacteria bacterium]MBI3296110.1 DUF4340 domain-containing protein [Deltaproteobacteria bacterium]
MRRSYSTTLSMLAALAVLTAWYFLYEKKFKVTSTQKEETAKQFVQLTQSDVQEIVLERMKNPPSEDAEATPPPGPVSYDRIHLKKLGDNWALTEPIEDTADSSAVSSLLSSVITAKQDRVVDDTPKDLSLFSLKDPIIKLTLIKDSTKKEQILFGRKTPVGFGVYVMNTDRKAVYKASQSVRSGVEKTVKDLRNRSLTSVTRADVNEVEVSGKANYVLKRAEKDAWLLARENLPADANETNKLVGALVDLKATDFPSEDGKNLAQYGLSPAGLRVVLSTSAKDKPRTVLLLGQASGKTYAKRDDKPTVYEVAADTWSKTTVASEKLRSLEVAHFNRFDIKRIKIERDQEPLDLLKESDWTLPAEPGTKLDTAKVDTLLTKIQDMKLARYGTTANTPRKPALVIRLFEKKDKAETETVVLKFGALGGNEIAVERSGLSVPFFIKGVDLKALTLDKKSLLKTETKTENADKKPSETKR